MNLQKEELEKLQGLVGDLNKIITDLGVLETQKHSLLQSYSVMDTELNEFKKVLNETYGDASINIQTGEINDKENG